MRLAKFYIGGYIFFKKIKKEDAAFGEESASCIFCSYRVLFAEFAISRLTSNTGEVGALAGLPKRCSNQKHKDAFFLRV